MPQLPGRENAGVAASELLLPVMAALLSGWLSKRAGRRATAFVGVLLMGVGQVMGAFAPDFVVFFVGFDTYTAGSQVTLQALLLEVVEVAPPHMRGRLVALGGVSDSVGTAMANAVMYGIRLTESQFVEWSWGFRMSLLLGLWPALLLLAVLPWMLESPSSLLQRGRLHEARQALQSVRGELADIREEFDGLMRAVNVGRGRSQVAQLITDRHQWPGFILAMCMAAMAAVMFPRWLQQSDSTLSAIDIDSDDTELPFLYHTLLPSIMFALGAVVCFFLADRASRRPLMVATASVLCALAAALAAAVRSHPLGGPRPPRHVTAWMVALFYLIHTFGAVGWYAVVFLVAAELQSINTRSAGLGCYIAVYFLVGRGLRRLVQPTDCTTKPGALIIYSAVSGAAAVFAWLLLPETSGAPLDAVPEQRIGTHWLWHLCGAPPPALPAQKSRVYSAAAARSMLQQAAAAEEAAAAALGLPHVRAASDGGGGPGASQGGGGPPEAAAAVTAGASC